MQVSRNDMLKTFIDSDKMVIPLIIKLINYDLLIPKRLIITLPFR